MGTNNILLRLLQAATTLGDVETIGYDKWRVNGKEMTSEELVVKIRTPVSLVMAIEDLKGWKSAVLWKPVMASLKDEGQVRPVYVNWEGKVLDGKKRVRAAAELGWKKVQVLKWRHSGK